MMVTLLLAAVTARAGGFCAGKYIGWGREREAAQP
jgi:hypothetical protein